MSEPSASGVEEAVSVGDYHERTKHSFQAYAKGPETIDWDAQPSPFRHFDGAGFVELPLVADHFDVPFAGLDNPAELKEHPLNHTHIGLMLEISLALSAWKQYGESKWSLRCNPSSGNLHPTETYLVVYGIEGLDNGVYHYRPDLHGLELRCNITPYSGSQPLVLLGFSSVHWREAWKYGERAYRYCQHDVGHAIAGVSYSCAALGWSVKPLLAVPDHQISALLGLDREQDFAGAEAEYPDVLLSIGWSSQSGQPGEDLVSSLAKQVAGMEWFGQANVLDARHLYQWPVIDEVAAACFKHSSAEQGEAFSDSWPSRLPSVSKDSAARLFRQRRSAQGFDGDTIMKRHDFLRMMDALLPRFGLAPWTGISWSTRIHLVLFIHRVEGIKPGLYCLPRTMAAVDSLKEAMRSEFLWQPVSDVPSEIPLYLLIAAKAERTAAQLSCQQPIAATSCFSLGMLGEFDPIVVEQPWVYRELFWEAGAIGQALYLEAEACFLRGTGIGCFYDDPVHQLLGLKDNRYQSLYHFTVGGALTDGRIASLPPYNR